MSRKNFFLKGKSRIVLFILTRTATSAFLSNKDGKVIVSNRNYRDRDNTAPAEASNRNGGNDNAKFASNNGRSCSKNYCKGDRAISKAAVFDLAGPLLRNR
jgi:hypothetical protein